MKINFRSVAILGAPIFGALALTWMFAPEALLSRWGLGLSGSAGFVGRRTAALYAGISAMFFYARNAPPSPARLALLKGALVACLLLAVLGTAELASGHAGPGILVAVAIEIALATAFLHAARTKQANH